MKSLRSFWMITIVLLTAASLLSILAVNWVTEASRWQVHTFLVFNKAENLLSDFKDADAAIISIKPDGVIISLNRGVEQLLGYRVEDLVGKQSLLIFHDAEVICLDGTTRWIVAKGEATRDATGNITNLHGTTVQDITERKLANDKLQAALNEKELLLKEVYHRVKNNLQVVSSLISLQARNVKNEETANQLKQSADRIKSMALIHEKFYQSKSLAKIDFNAYIHSLVEHLLFSHGEHSGRITINMEIDDLFLDVNTAIPCGLLINELLSNALKHAFPDDRHGEIGISFRQDQDEFLLVIPDNGIGFPTDPDYKKNTSLGMQLVATLTDQLQGQLTLDKTNGSTFTIRFILT